VPSSTPPSTRSGEAPGARGISLLLVETKDRPGYRVGRVLDAESRLNRLLSDPTVPADNRIELLNKVVEAERLAKANKAVTRDQVLQNANKEAAAVLGFSGAVGAYGGFFIPKSYGTSIALMGSPVGALYAFILFYATCLIVTWWFYSRKNAEMPC